MKFVEGLNLELKQQATEDIRKTVLAFANTGGGIVYVGIADDGAITGVSDATAANSMVLS